MSKKLYISIRPKFKSKKYALGDVKQETYSNTNNKTKFLVLPDVFVITRDKENESAATSQIVKLNANEEINSIDINLPPEIKSTMVPINIREPNPFLYENK
jgi:hypothetical protein